MFRQLYSTEHIRETERKAVAQGLSEETLMQRAADAALNFLLSNYGQKKRIVICCGQGNNGGDGYVLAKLLKKARFSVTVLHEKEKPQATTSLGQWAITQALKQKVECKPFNKETLMSADIIVDALAGIGLNTPLRSILTEIVDFINAANKPVVSLDLPSGLSANSGAVLGAAVKATHTITFIAYKPGLFTGAGVEYAGNVILADLNLPQEILSHCTPVATLMDWSSAPRLPKRSRDAHKGLFGRVLVIGGNHGMGGSVLLATQAAYRAGAGVVTLATRKEHIAPMLSHMPEVMACSIEKESDIERLLLRAKAIVLGPGLGYDHWAQTLFQMALNANKPCVLDADGLNLLAACPSVLKNVTAPLVLTPHPREAARLLGVRTAEIQADRFAALSALIERYPATVVLKGAGTLIGEKGSSTRTLCAVGNPGMASGGMGDLLSGIIAALLAQGLPPETAASLGVCVHGHAGDLAARSGERGMVASDLLVPLRQLMN